MKNLNENKSFNKVANSFNENASKQKALARMINNELVSELIQGKGGEIPFRREKAPVSKYYNSPLEFDYNIITNQNVSKRQQEQGKPSEIIMVEPSSSSFNHKMIASSQKAPHHLGSNQEKTWKPSHQHTINVVESMPKSLMDTNQYY
mmetsp:Transcript_16363/g.15699  ORF Transcript_16363/g.15699 Transcript_16363/m.15699 type:complete len:148 (-) Transcript_16363:158-601(-)